MKIASGAAKGLAFLHETEKPIIYRDFKASNILITQQNFQILGWQRMVRRVMTLKITQPRCSYTSETKEKTLVVLEEEENCGGHTIVQHLISFMENLITVNIIAICHVSIIGFLFFFPLFMTYNSFAEIYMFFYMYI